MSRLYDLVQNIKLNDKISMSDIIKKFNPLLSRWSFKVNKDSEDMYNELVICLIQTVQKMPDIKSEKKIICYINTSIRNKFFQLSNQNKCYLRCELKEVECSQDISMTNTNELFLTNIILKEAIEKLTFMQKEIILLKYYQGLLDKTIAERLKISRQTVYRHRIKALSILSNELLGSDTQ